MSSESALLAALEVKYPPQAYAFFSHVRDGTGYGAGRTADAVCFGLWPSRGLEVEGFELKVSRSDWLRELKDPAKAESVCQFCDRWWVVVSDAGIVKDGELPPTWGLYVLKGEKLAVTTRAPKLKANPLDRPFVAAFMRRVQEKYVARAMVQPKMEDAFARGREFGQKSSVHEHTAHELAALKKAVHEFEEASGVTVSQWNGRQVGEAVRLVLDRGTECVLKDVERTKAALERMAKSIGGALEVARKEVIESGENTG